MEVEAVDEGTVAKLVVPAGTEGVKVNALIAVLAAEGEDVALPPRVAMAPHRVRRRPKPAPAPKAEAACSRLRLPRPLLPAGSCCRVAAAATRVFSSPLARRLAKDAGIDLSAVAGSGPHGRVVKSRCRGGRCRRRSKGCSGCRAELLRLLRQPHRALRRAMSDEAVLKLFEQAPTSSCRMTACARRSPGACSRIQADHPAFLRDARLRARCAAGAAHPAQRRRAEDRKGGAPAYKLSVNDMVIKAMALALRDVPDANVSWTDSEHGQAQACRCRRCRLDPRRPDHADHPQARRRRRCRPSPTR